MFESLRQAGRRREILNHLGLGSVILTMGRWEQAQEAETARGIVGAWQCHHKRHGIDLPEQQAYRIGYTLLDNGVVHATFFDPESDATLSVPPSVWDQVVMRVNGRYEPNTINGPVFSFVEGVTRGSIAEGTSILET